MKLCRAVCSKALATAVNTPSGGTAAGQRLDLFFAEKDQQWANEELIVKVKVNLVDLAEQPLKGIRPLLLNRRRSTPFHCAKHMGSVWMNSSVLAYRPEDKKVLSLHQPLMQDSSLVLLNTNLALDQPTTGLGVAQLLTQINEAYWTSCALFLGSTLEGAFTEEGDDRIRLIGVVPSCQVNSGSFAYDVQLPKALKDWRPSKTELDTLTRRTVRRMGARNMAFEPLCVTEKVAGDMFEGNAYKLAQIQTPSTDDSSAVTETGDALLVDRDEGHNVNLVRVGEFVDVVDSPLTIANTAHIGLMQIVHTELLDLSEEGVTVHRFHGVSLPRSQMVPSHTWNVICENARRQEEKSTCDPWWTARHSKD